MNSWALPARQGLNVLCWPERTLSTETQVLVVGSHWMVSGGGHGLYLSNSLTADQQKRQGRNASEHGSVGSTSPTIFSKSPELLRRLTFLLQSLGFCVARIEGSGSLPCHPSRLGLTTSWETEEEKFGFFSRKQFPQQSTRLYQCSALSYWAGSPGGLGATFQEQKKKKNTLPFSPCLGKLDHTGMAPCPPPTTRKLAWLAAGRVGRKAEPFERVPRCHRRGGRRQG